MKLENFTVLFLIFVLNPAKVELMYFPVVNANNDGKRIWITERNTK